MNWKQENPKNRYIDSITEGEAKQIAFLALAEPEEFELIRVVAECNGNNIPHVEIYCRFQCMESFETVEDYVGIFENLNTYRSNDFSSVYCQAKIFDLYKEWGFE